MMDACKQEIGWDGGERNTDAIRLYQRQGFLDVGSQAFTLGDH
jgi:hypothetical protein